MSRLLAPARLASQLLAGAADRLSPGRDDEPAPSGAELAGPVRGDWFPGVAQQLRCEPGRHDWARAAVRGRKPTACPEHRATD